MVSLVPSLTEAIAVSAPGRLVGATDYCTHPPELDVARVGGSKYPRLPAVLDLAPDLVVANTEENRRPDVEVLRGAGIEVWVTPAPVDVPAALEVLRSLLDAGLGVPEPGWLRDAAAEWSAAEPVRVAAVVPVWRRPWVVLGRDTFAGDVLRRLGVDNAYARDPQRYPRPPLSELRAAAEFVVLPDEPYPFSAEDGPEAFPDARCALVSGRHLTWYGPSLVEARALLTAQLALP